jgi:hypothetical protein
MDGSYQIADLTIIVENAIVISKFFIRGEQD